MILPIQRSNSDYTAFCTLNNRNIDRRHHNQKNEERRNCHNCINELYLFVCFKRWFIYNILLMRIVMMIDPYILL